MKQSSYYQLTAKEQALYDLCKNFYTTHQRKPRLIVLATRMGYGISNVSQRLASLRSKGCDPYKRSDEVAAFGETPPPKHHEVVTPCATTKKEQIYRALLELPTKYGMYTPQQILSLLDTYL